MTPQKQTEAMITLQHGKSGYSGYCRDYPDYMRDYNAVHSVLNGLSDRHLVKYRLCLHNVTRPKGQFVPAMCPQKGEILATPAEMTEAILKATGLWQPEETP